MPISGGPISATPISGPLRVKPPQAGLPYALFARQDHMAIKGQPLTVTYVAWNTSTGAYQTGDAANHTLYKIKDGAAPAATTNSPSEPSSTETPGVYQIALTAAEMTAAAVRVAGTSSTSGVVLIFAGDIITEQGVLPGGTTPATAGGLLTIGSGAGQIAPDGAGNVHATDTGGNALATHNDATTIEAAVAAVGAAVGSPVQAGATVPANVVEVNGIGVTGAGTSGDPWGPV